MTQNSCVSNNNGTAHSDALHNFEIIGYRYVLSTICIFGIVCNLLNLCVLLQRRLKESPYTYLTGLAFADMLTLISISPASIVRSDYIRNENIFYLLSRLESQIYMPLANYFGQVSIMITVALTVERYLFTTYPLHTQRFCKPSYARRVIAIIVILCALTSIPRFLGDRLEKYVNIQENFRSSQCATYPFVIESSSINSSFIGQCFCVISHPRQKLIRLRSYYYPTMLVINQILPFAILLCLNLSLIHRVQLSNRFILDDLITRQQHSLTSTATTPTIKQKRLRDEHRLTKTLVAVVIVFLICNTFTIISYPSLVQFVTKRKYPNYINLGFRIQKLITNIMLLLNYSINFFFYCAFNQKFLDTLKTTFFSKKCICCRYSTTRDLTSPHGQLSNNSPFDSRSKTYQHRMNNASTRHNEF